MKKSLRFLWQYYLYLCAKLYLKRTHPFVIVVAGSVGKTTTKDAIFAVLSRALYTKSVRSSSGNLNSDIGVPLSILNFHRAIPLSQIPASIFRAIARALFLKKTDLLILEYAIDHPGDMDYLCRLARPDIAVLTPIAEEHLEFLGDLETVYAEEEKLLTHLKPEGTGVIHHDKHLLQTFLPRRFTYGLTSEADLYIKAAEVKLTGTNLDTVILGQTISIRSPLLGFDHNLAVLAALATGFVLNADLSLCIAALADYTPSPGRLRLIEGRSSTTIIDDSYNASPASMAAALKLLHQVAGARRQVAILGTMRELGEYAESAHRNIGRILPKLTKVAVLIGPYRDIMKEEAIRAGLKEENIYIFEKPEQAKSAAKKLIKKGDFVLVKASRALHFEDIVKSLMKHPNRAHELLVH